MGHNAVAGTAECGDESAGEGAPRRTLEAAVTAHGVLYVHSSPPAICPHLEWAVAAVLAMPVKVTWTPQPLAAGTLRTELAWRGRPGTAGRLAAALREWPSLRYEVTEDPSEANNGERFLRTPGLGLTRATMGVNGDVLVSEHQLHALLAEAADDAEALGAGLRRLLVAAWDAELEPFRRAAEDTTVRWLSTRVG